MRHGEPNYALDCLTEQGKLQAEAAAKRLAGEGIMEIYSSPSGRARETALYTARELDLPVTILDYMREISWGGEGVPENGHPWTLSDWLIDREDFDFALDAWQEHSYFKNNAATKYWKMICENIDAFLSKLGYERAGRRYFCASGTDKTIALFSHGGSGACALSRILSLPFPYVSSVMPYGFTSVTILDFPVQSGQYVHPRIELFNDCAHIGRKAEGPRLQKDSQ